MNRFGVFCIFLLIYCSQQQVSFGQQTHHWETVFYSNSLFSYTTSSEGIPDPDWRNPDFDDSLWRTGVGGMGYGDGDDSTVVESCISLCLRKSFQIFDTSVITDALLSIDYDDAFVAYLNGFEIARSGGLSGQYPSYNQASTINHEAVMYSGGVPESFFISGDELETIIKEGNNLLAVQIHNRSLVSSDLSSNIFFSVGLSINQVQYLSTPSWFEPPFIFEGSTLPLFIIDTYGQSIPDEPKIDAHMKIIFDDNGAINKPEDSANVYDGVIGIEIRGATSSGYPQKPYAIETRDSLGENNNVPILGMPAENDWVLLSHYNEKTFMRNAISFYLFAEMGYYSPRVRLCEVILNNKYEGIYLFGEKIKRDKNRVNISKITSQNISGISLTGGYIFKVDYYNSYNSWLSDYSPIDHPSYQTHFVYYYPKPDSIVSEQKTYLKSCVDQFQSVLHQADFADNYSNYIDIPSFIDYFLVSELSRNVDGYKKSRWFFKDRDDVRGLINAGPVWDFDWAWKNINTCFIFKNTDGSGWAYKINDCYETPSPGWMVRLLQDPAFQDMVKCRYTELRETLLSNSSINSFLDSIYYEVEEAQVNHYKRWDILGVRTGAPEVESPAQSYEEEVSRLRNWISLRLAWLDANMPGSSNNCNTTYSTALGDDIIFRMFPNPATTDLYIESDSEMNFVEIIDITGKKVYSDYPEKAYSLHLNIAHIQPGLYIVIIRTLNGKSMVSKLLIN